MDSGDGLIIHDENCTSNMQGFRCNCQGRNYISTPPAKTENEIVTLDEWVSEAMSAFADCLIKK